MFKIGDTVIIINNSEREYELNKGDKFIVTEIDRDGDIWCQGWCLHRRRIVTEEVYNSPLFKALNEN